MSEPVLDFDAYRATVADAGLALDVRSPHANEFRGRFTALTGGDIHVLGIRASGHGVIRTPAHVARAPRSLLKLTVVERGEGLVVQDGRESLLRPGDIAVYDTERPYSLLFAEQMRMSVVMFPRILLDAPASQLATLTARRLDRHPALARIVGPFIAQLARRSADLGPYEARRLARTAVDMVGALLDANIPEESSSGRERDALVRRILAYVEENLDAPTLRPSEIADAHFISVRALHALFATRGTTVSTVVRVRRLERCYDELLDPRLIDRSISTIALENGFADAAHFSRAFRAHFGMPPSALRQSGRSEKLSAPGPAAGEGAGRRGKISR